MSRARDASDSGAGRGARGLLAAASALAGLSASIALGLLLLAPGQLGGSRERLAGGSSPAIEATASPAPAATSRSGDATPAREIAEADGSPSPRASEPGAATSSPDAEAPSPTARVVTATPEPPGRRPELPGAVDWPEMPELAGRQAITRTRNFEVHAADPEDVLLVETARRWAPRLEDILAEVRRNMDGRPLPRGQVALAFTRAYEARCPARGLAAVRGDPPLLLVFIDERTSDLQIRAVLAHEMAHHLSLDEAFVGDGVLTEGIANWAAGRYALAWQGWPDWQAAARHYLQRGAWISITDETGLQPRPGESCIARRDRLYNIRTAFVDWLIGRIGLDRVLAMPRLEVRWRDSDGEEQARIQPDYQAATGHTLTELERIWIEELRRGVEIEAW